MGKHADSTDSKILRRIQSRKRGWVFTPDSFTDLGTRQAVDLALMRHRDSGLIRQLARGLYDYPKTDPQLGPLQPSTDDIVSALAGRDATRLQPSGAYAANLLGLSTQVPMKVVYLTDGRTRTVQIGKRQIILKCGQGISPLVATQRHCFVTIIQQHTCCELTTGQIGEFLLPAQVSLFHKPCLLLLGSCSCACRDKRSPSTQRLATLPSTKRNKAAPCHETDFPVGSVPISTPR